MDLRDLFKIVLNEYGLLFTHVNTIKKLMVVSWESLLSTKRIWTIRKNHSINARGWVILGYS